MIKWQKKKMEKSKSLTEQFYERYGKDFDTNNLIELVMLRDVSIATMTEENEALFSKSMEHIKVLIKITEGNCDPVNTAKKSVMLLLDN